MTEQSAVVLLSGGLDSSTALAITLESLPVAAAVFVNYGQRHIREASSARAIAAFYDVELVELDLTAFGRSVHSALTSPDVPVPHGHYADANMVVTVVPNRNATMLSAAAGIAASRGATEVVTAVHSGDHAIYPDCRPEFILALSSATLLGCGVRIRAPFVNLTKAEIASQADRAGVPTGLTWSCYEGGERHCGRCATCVERAEAFSVAGVPDPTDYADCEFWKSPGVVW